VCDGLRRVYNLIGLANRAGKVSAGTMAAKTSLLRRRAVILLMSEDISENTKQSLQTVCSRQKIPWLMFGNKYDLGTSVGKAYRVAVTVNDEGFKNAIISALASLGEEVKSMGVVEWPK